MKKTAKFLIEKIVAIAMILIGFHLLVSYIAKVLPFGLITEDIGIWGVWAYMGWLFAAIALATGCSILFRRNIKAR